MISLSAGDAAVVLAPETGGAIAGWRLGHSLVLRQPEPAAMLGGPARRLSAFPLVPFSNRIADGRFAFAGTEHTLTRADPSFAVPIHGLGWIRPWTLTSVSASAARLHLRHPMRAADLDLWPFPFDAELRFDLAPDALTVGLAMTNRHTGPAPAGLGLHPYFPRTAAASLRFAATGVWLTDAGQLPTELVPIPPGWDHAAGRRIGTVALDHVFAGWDGRAEISLAPGPVTVAIEASGIFRHVVVYTPPGAPYFCVEPVSHMTDAVNRAASRDDTGLVVLAPGATLEGEIAFRLRGA
ncbi:MAG: aldose 1-epimerase [Proteobacteria bacterium]|nr:aldose 1-epimerase [Pseudomonadota bacterium]